MKTYQYEILPPYLIKDKSNFCVCPYFNNSKQLLVALCCPFACFYNNEFLWLDDNIHKKINQKYSFNFFNCELIKNINKDLADKLALVVRVLFYKEKLELYNGDKKMFTNTYISFIFNKIKIYCLIDLNIDEKSNRFNNLLKKINFPNKEN